MKDRENRLDLFFIYLVICTALQLINENIEVVNKVSSAISLHGNKSSSILFAFFVSADDFVSRDVHVTGKTLNSDIKRYKVFLLFSSDN